MRESIAESIIIPMNPKGSFRGGSTPGSIIAQQWFADREGKGIVSFDNSCGYSNSLRKPHLGFFRDTSKSELQVTHRFSIVDITNDWGVTQYLEKSTPPWNKKFLPPWRHELYNDAYKDRIRRRTWILISDIFKLKEPKELSYFGKKSSRSFVYSSHGSELAYSEEKPDPDKFIDDIIFRSMRRGIRFTEDDLELIVWAWLVKNDAEYLERQRKVEGGLRLDLLTKYKDEYIVMELKRDIATKDALDNQLHPYMERVMKKLDLKKLKGMIIARDASAELEKELNKTRNKDIAFVPYQFFLRLDIGETL